MSEPAPTAPEPLIELENASVASLEAPGQAIVEGVDWTIRQNEYWVVGGLPGGGKSDLLATAAGLLRPLKGSQRLFGREVREADGDALALERHRIGLVFGDGGRLFRHLTVTGNLALPFCYHHNCTEDEAAGEVNPLMAAMELTFLAHVPASRLNRSWRQRVALARALLARPEVLFLDNPLSGLDARQIRWWLDMLAQLSRGHALFGARPITLVVATDDVRPWLNRGRQFALLKQNRWIQLGTQAGEITDPSWQELVTEPLR